MALCLTLWYALVLLNLAHESKLRPTPTIPTHSEIDDRPEALALLCAIKANLPVLEQLLLETESTWGKADHLYRFYHQSYKVYPTQEMTLRIVGALYKF